MTPSIATASIRALLLASSAQYYGTHGFVVPPARTTTTTFRTTSTTAVGALAEIDQGAVDSARGLFFLWFFGASGGGGIAVSAFPKMYDRFQEVQELKGQGPTLGGEALDLPSFITGYPEDVKRADVAKVLANKKTVNDIVAAGPQESFWAQKGYLRYDAFLQANADCNPLAVRAVFDSLGTASTVEPDVAQELLEKYREDMGEFTKTLLASKTKGWSSIGTLLFLLGIAAYVSGEALAGGWFPQWPGNDNFPLGLVSPGVWTIPQYWI